MKKNTLTKNFGYAMNIVKLIDDAKRLENLLDRYGRGDVTARCAMTDEPDVLADIKAKYISAANKIAAKFNPPEGLCAEEICNWFCEELDRLSKEA